MLKRFVASKLSKQSGETLVETLVSLLIIVSIAIALPMAFVTAAKINKQADEMPTSCTMDRSSGNVQSSSKVTIQGAAATPITVDGATVYSSDGFYFYDYD